MQPYEELIAELSKQLNSPLHPDRRMAVKMRFPAQNVVIQIDLAPDGESLLISTHILELVPGHFRERVFKETLKFNAAFQKRGIFGFCDKKNLLAFFRFFPLKTTTGEELAEFVISFVKDAKEWKEGLTKGEIPYFEVALRSDGKIFGIK